MSEMVKLAGTVEDANKMSRASDQSKPWAEAKEKDKGKEKALYCRIHKQGDHDTDHCYSVVKLANSKHGVQQQPKRNRLCDFCHEVPYRKGHSCTPMLEYNARKDAEAKQQHKKIMARFAALKYLGKEHNEIDVDELMGSSSKQCKNDIWVRATQKEKTDECLLIPIMIQNIEIMALLDTGCTPFPCQ
ncbi:hypothetical protein O0I10_005400 [Lichtheimia ornata]|uniref:Uncharacterized protein n=1 Tax=Lichtheimia ornata TaxID=688661 RepID=A0AAD7XZU9_9FUNG|nr:uncharacterized protein O0I10_005400 [Lichtheimia ornata]KAJ8659018.1 hypothetical protein O0I10_005400 [Lichtheimia ornata]